MIVDQRLLGEMNNESQGIEQHELVILGRQGGERIDDRRSVQNDHEQYIPDHGKVAEFDVQRRGDKREREHDDIDEDGKQKEHADGRQAGHESFEREKESDDQEIHQKDERGVDGGSQDNGPAGHVNLGDQLRLGEQRLHARTGAFGKEVKHHQRHEQLQGIGVRPGRTRIEYRRKHEIEHGESEQRLEQGPEVSQNAPVIAKLEVGLGEHPDELFVVLVLSHFKIFINQLAS